MELSRRDAVVALAAAGVGVGTGTAVSRLAADEPSSGPLDEEHVATLAALASVLYPSELEGVEAFVERYVDGRLADDPERAAGVVDALGYLDDYTRAWLDERFSALDPGPRDEVLRRMNADTAEPDPQGSDVERVRYYLVNELLFALYASPTGGELVGLENPPGHPGGLASYQRGPR
ncbi:MAG: gluconate 2-dehydrogenase subunit 3 family protein [Halobacteriales archaeon]